MTKNILAFFLGVAVTTAYTFISGGAVDQSDPERERGVSTGLVKERFSDICNVLESEGCSCRPTVLTEARCSVTLTKALYQAEGMTLIPRSP